MSIFLKCTLCWRTAYAQRNLKVILIKNHRKSLLFSYYKLGFRCLELNLFSRCFYLKKRFEPLRNSPTYCLPDQMPQMYVVYASKSDSSFLRNKHLFFNRDELYIAIRNIRSRQLTSHVIKTKNRNRSMNKVKNLGYDR